MSKKKIKPDFSKPKEAEQPQEEKEFPQEAEYEGLPLVVIAGRPNVGKSTLFNRFLHRRIAITNDQPGVTRDPVEATAFLNA